MTRVQIEIFLGTLLVIITSIFLVGYGLGEEDRMAENAISQEAKAIEAGASLFEINCTGCHGVKGEGIPGLAPPLSDRALFTTRLSDVGWSGSLEDYIIATVSSGRLVSTRPDQYVGGGRPAMPAWSEAFGGPLREDQIRSIAQYILNWEATALEEVSLVQIATPTPVANDPISRGQVVFQSNICGACHTLGNLSTGTAGPNLTQLGSVAVTRVGDLPAEDYIRQSILDPNAYIVEGFNPDIMPKNFNEQLSSKQLDDLGAFLLPQQ